MIKLIITDLDGTFLNSNGSYDIELYSKVKQMLDKKGIEFAACTGKQCERVEELFNTSVSKNMWILGDSATRIKRNGDYVYQSLLPNPVGLRIISKLDQIATDHTIICCTPTAAYIKTSTPKEDADKIRKSYAVVKTLDNLQSIKEDFVKITVFDPHLRCFESVKRLSDFKELAYIVASEAAWIDISNHGVHKGTTVAQLQKMIAIRKEETIAFGDGLNDIELFDSVGSSFAVGNAFDEVQKKADFIVKTNDQNGVLRTIEKLIKLQS